jgi:UDP-glucose 4-epimerase
VPLTVVVTGGAGFIGSHLCDTLVGRGYAVVCIDDLSKGTVDNIRHLLGEERFRFERLDIRQHGPLIAAGRDADVVVHLAAAKIPRYGNAFPVATLNVEGARSALELAAALRAKFVLASTSDVYGKSADLPFREDGDIVLGPSTSRRWAYAASKLLDEHMALAFHDELGIPVTLLRFFGAYGERQYLNWWGGPQGVFLDAIEHDQPIEVHGDGQQTRCFIHVTDLAEATARAVERPEANNEIINVGTEEEISMLELARLMHELSGKAGQPNLEFIDYSSFSANYEDVRRRVPDMRKLQELLEFTPAITLREGLTRLWEWYRARRT